MDAARRIDFIRIIALGDRCALPRICSEGFSPRLPGDIICKDWAKRVPANHIHRF